MELAFTAVFKKVPEGYVAFVEELPGANTQGETLEEARENLREAVEMVLDANRALVREESRGSHFRADFPATSDAFEGHVVLRPGAEPALEPWR